MAEEEVSWGLCEEAVADPEVDVDDADVMPAAPFVRLCNRRAAADMAAPSVSIGSRLAPAAESKSAGIPIASAAAADLSAAAAEKLGMPSGRLGSKSHSKPSKKLTSKFFSLASKSGLVWEDLSPVPGVSMAKGDRVPLANASMSNMLGPDGSKSGGGGGLKADSEKREEPTLGEAGLLPLERLPLRLLDLLAMWMSS